MMGTLERTNKGERKMVINKSELFLGGLVAVAVVVGSYLLGDTHGEAKGRLAERGTRKKKPSKRS